MSNMDRLQKIKDIIESMNKCYQTEILKLLIQNSVVLSENSNGTFINLTDVSNSVLNILEKYIEFVNKQQNQLLHIEKEKAYIKQEFFKQEKRNIKSKRNKETNNIVLDE